MKTQTINSQTIQTNRQMILVAARVGDVGYPDNAARFVLVCLCTVLCLVACSSAAWGAAASHSDLAPQADSFLGSASGFPAFPPALAGIGIFQIDGDLEIDTYPVDQRKRVVEGDDGFSHFRIMNLSKVNNLDINSVTVSTSPTTGDKDDWAKVDTSGGCPAVLAPQGVCTIVLHFKTDTADDPPENDFGVTTFTEKVVATEGAALFHVQADSTVTVTDCGAGKSVCHAPSPEPTNLLTFGSGLLGVSAFLRKRYFS